MAVSKADLLEQLQGHGQKWQLRIAASPKVSAHRADNGSIDRSSWSWLEQAQWASRMQGCRRLLVGSY